MKKLIICAFAISAFHIISCGNNTNNGETLAVETDTTAVLSAESVATKTFTVSEIPSEIRAKMEGVSMPVGGAKEVGFDDLRYLRMSYVDFEGNDQVGEMVCHKYIAEDMIYIFSKLYEARYQIAQMRLIDEFGGSDDESMAADNTSSFNYRVVAGSKSLSKHAYGMAVDINPLENPYINSKGTVSPKGGELYVDRKSGRPHMIDENDLCYKLFIERGFIWGGAWNSVKDYQHFQKSLPEK